MSLFYVDTRHTLSLPRAGYRVCITLGSSSYLLEVEVTFAAAATGASYFQKMALALPSSIMHSVMQNRKNNDNDGPGLIICSPLTGREKEKKATEASFFFLQWRERIIQYGHRSLGIVGSYIASGEMRLSSLPSIHARQYSVKYPPGHEEIKDYLGCGLCLSLTLRQGEYGLIKLDSAGYFSWHM